MTAKQRCERFVKSVPREPKQAGKMEMGGYCAMYWLRDGREIHIYFMDKGLDHWKIIEPDGPGGAYWDLDMGIFD